MAVAAAGARAEIMVKDGAGAEKNMFGSATLSKLIYFRILKNSSTHHWIVWSVVFRFEYNKSSNLPPPATR